MRYVLMILTMCSFWETCIAGVRFDGTDDYISLSTGRISSLLNGAPGVSCTMWYKAFSLPTTDDSDIILNILIHDTGTGFSMAFRNNGGTQYVRAAGRSQGGDGFQQGLAPFSATGEWVFIAGILDFVNDEIRVSVNGNDFVTTSVSFGSSTWADSNDQTLIDTINGLAGTGYFADIQVSSICVYNKILTMDNIQKIYQARTMYVDTQIGGENVTVYYPLYDLADDQPGNGRVFKDQSGNRINGIGDDGANNSGLIGKAEEVLSFPE